MADRRAVFGATVMASAMLTATAAIAACPPPTAGTGVAHPLSAANKDDVDLILSMSMMPKLLKIDRQTIVHHALPCALGHFTANGSDYDLRASPEDAGTGRAATSGTKDAPVAELIPVTNILAAIEAAKTGKTAAVSGYMLATFSPAGTTGWRLYTAVPDQATLIADMTAAIEGRMRPVFRTDAKTGKTDIFMAG